METKKRRKVIENYYRKSVIKMKKNTEFLMMYFDICIIYLYISICNLLIIIINSQPLAMRFLSNNLLQQKTLLQNKLLQSSSSVAMIMNRVWTIFSSFFSCSNVFFSLSVWTNALVYVSPFASNSIWYYHINVYVHVVPFLWFELCSVLFFLVVVNL